MTTIFISHAPEDTASAHALRQSLEASGYNVWREPATLSLKSMLYERTIDNALLGCAAVVLVWSSSAVQSVWVKRHTLLADRLKKPILPVLLDNTSLPNTLTVVNIIMGQAPFTDTVAQLLPLLPPPNSTNPVIALWEQASHDSLISIQARKTAIDQAADLLKQQAHREAALALLRYFAQHDLMPGVRDKASTVLEEDAKKVGLAPLPAFLNPNDVRHTFGVPCEKCGHITYFDKRRVCTAQEKGVRKSEEQAVTRLHKLVLTCEKCGAELPISIDCEGY